MNRNKCKILVLSDLKDNSVETVKYAIEISKELNGALELFCVKKPNEIVITDNQLSAMRACSKQFVKTEQKAKNIIKAATNDNFFPVRINIEFGNIKSEIENYIETTNPDFIIIGKKQKKFLNFNGDNITDFTLNRYSSKICIAQQTTISEIFDTLNSKIKKGKSA